jgi:hypothetical protein
VNTPSEPFTRELRVFDLQLLGVIFLFFIWLLLTADVADLVLSKIFPTKSD